MIVDYDFVYERAEKKLKIEGENDEFVHNHVEGMMWIGGWGGVLIVSETA